MKRSVVTSAFLLILLLVTAALIAGREQLSAQEPAVADDVLPRAYLPVVRNFRDKYDMADFIVGDGRLYEVWVWIASQNTSSQARHQTQFVGQRFYHTKGNEFQAEWEELWMDNDFVYRGTDTSPGDGRYYTLRDGVQYGSRWSPRYWKIGDIFERNPRVTFYDKGSCSVIYDYPFRSWLKLVAYYPEFTFTVSSPPLNPIKVYEVIELAWLLQKDGQPEERYFYARDFGLVGWANNHGSYSRISEIHGPGARPDNKREVIGCLNTGYQPIPDRPIFPPQPYEPPFRVK